MTRGRQPELFPVVDPFLDAQLAILEDDASTADDVLIACARLFGRSCGVAGDPHLMGYRGEACGAHQAETLRATGWRLTRERATISELSEGG